MARPGQPVCRAWGALLGRSAGGPSAPAVKPPAAPVPLQVAWCGRERRRGGAAGQVGGAAGRGWWAPHLRDAGAGRCARALRGWRAVAPATLRSRAGGPGALARGGVIFLCFASPFLRLSLGRVRRMASEMESSLEGSFSSSGAVSGASVFLPPARSRIFKIIVIGDSNVGKTCLTYRFCAGRFPDRTEATIGVDFRERAVEIDGERIKVSGGGTVRGGRMPWDAGSQPHRGLIAGPVQRVRSVFSQADVEIGAGDWKDLYIANLKDSAPQTLMSRDLSGQLVCCCFLNADSNFGGRR